MYTPPCGAEISLGLDLGRREAPCCRPPEGEGLDDPASVETNKLNREEHAMTSTLLSRRDVLKGTVALAAAASVGVATPTQWRRAEAQESAALPRARIDGVLHQAVDAGVEQIGHHEAHTQQD